MIYLFSILFVSIFIAIFLVKELLKKFLLCNAFVKQAQNISIYKYSGSRQENGSSEKLVE